MGHFGLTFSHIPYRLDLEKVLYSQKISVDLSSSSIFQVLLHNTYLTHYSKYKQQHSALTNSWKCKNSSKWHELFQKTKLNRNKDIYFFKIEFCGFLRIEAVLRQNTHNLSPRKSLTFKRLRAEAIIFIANFSKF